MSKPLDRHLVTNYPVRIEPDTKQRLKAVLEESEWTLQDFFLACVAMLMKRPKTFLAQLAPHRPAERRGRPKKG